MHSAEITYIKIGFHILAVALFVFFVISFIFSIVGWTTHWGWEFCEKDLPTCNSTVAPKYCEWGA